MTSYIRILILRTMGNFLVLSSLFIIAKTMYLPLREEFRYYRDQFQGKTYEVTDAIPERKDAITPAGFFRRSLTLLTTAEEREVRRVRELKRQNDIEILQPVNADFSIVIPKIAANSAIIPNVNAGNEAEYRASLQNGVAHALGTYFPGEGNNIFLFAHSTDYFWNVGTYNAVFYLLYKLETGDEVNLFYRGYRYRYIITGREIVNPDQIEYLTKDAEEELLTLQTCWPPGTTLKRLMVFAKPVRN